MTLRAWFRANVAAPEPIPTLSVNDTRDRPSLASIDWSHMPAIDGPKSDPWSHVKDRD